MYNYKRVAITGATGFLGSKISNQLRAEGAFVVPLVGDVRKPEIFKHIDYSYDYLFHFGAPSSQILFQREPDYAFDVTINGFRNAMRACEENGVKLIYPSTGLLSFDKPNEYARGKQICEDLAAKAKCDHLGLRIFGTYGPGEEMKRDFASVPYLFMKDMVEGRQPVIFGDGRQERDFIYIADTVNSILAVADQRSGGTVDIGSGETIAFKGLVNVINEILGKDIQPVFVDKPSDYIDKTGADITELKKYYQPKISFKEGMRELIEHERQSRNRVH